MLRSFQNYVALFIAAVFARPQLFKFNLFLYKLSLRSLGVLNAQGDRTSGEKWLMDFLSREKIGIMVDVGANTKVFGVDELAAEKIYAFEPHPRTYAMLQKNSPKVNEHGTPIELINSAVGAKSGKAKLWDFADDAKLKHTQPTSTLASLNKDVIEELHGQKAQAFSVPLKTLDNFVRQEKIEHIDFLKIDVEGLELSVLEGAKKLLKSGKISLIQFEFNQMHVYQRVFFRDFVEVLSGYDLYRLSPNGLLKLPEYSPVTHEIFAFQNILAVLRVE